MAYVGLRRLWDYVGGIVFFALIVLVGLGLKALLALAGVPNKVAGAIAIIGGFMLVFGGLAVASLISDGVIKIEKNQRNDQ